MDDGMVLLPNDRYPLDREVFRLYLSLIHILLPNTRPFPVPGKMTGKIPIGRKVSRRYSPCLLYTSRCV